MSDSPKSQGELKNIRDTVESIWIAIVLAFVLRAFMIEAFVIPTGSMAPRLMGEHYRLTCDSCKYSFDFGRSKRFIGRNGAHENWPGARCPNCAYPIDAKPQKVTPKGGDRVLVLKYFYRFSEPEPWDVVVFKNPQDNTQNYIKRLIGLPGETIELVHGDVFYRSDPSEPWRIRRKPYDAQEAMWQVVFNNDYRPDMAIYREVDPGREPPTWGKESDSSDWDLTLEQGRRFRFDGNRREQKLTLRTERTDFLPHYGYNSPRMEDASQIDPKRDLCTDLKLAFTFRPGDESSQVAMILSSLEHWFRAEVSAEGTVRLLHRLSSDAENDWTVWSETRVDPLKAGKAYELALTHADFRATVWIDEKPLLESTESQYPADYAAIKKRMQRIPEESSVPTPQIQIAAAGGPSELGHVKLMRDVYYTSPRLGPTVGWRTPQGDFAREMMNLEDDRSPEGWGVMNNPIHLEKRSDDSDLDEFFVLGDNSPQSLDSRGWVLAAPSLKLYDSEDSDKPLYKLGTVPRYNMIGKAFFVYWPAGFTPPGLRNPALIPNVGRMRLIR